jgi:hypothetical protein
MAANHARSTHGRGRDEGKADGRLQQPINGRSTVRFGIHSCAQLVLVSATPLLLLITKAVSRRIPGSRVVADDTLLPSCPAPDPSFAFLPAAFHYVSAIVKLPPAN